MPMPCWNESELRCLGGVQSTYDDAVGAGDGGAAALGARANANDADGAAAEREQDVDVLQDDAEQAQEGRARRGVGLRSKGRISRCVQHGCRLLTGSVLVQQAVAGADGAAFLAATRAAGVATARRGRESVAKTASLENILEVCKSWVRGRRERFAGDPRRCVHAFYTVCPGLNMSRCGEVHFQVSRIPAGQALRTHVPGAEVTGSTVVRYVFECLRSRRGVPAGVTMSCGWLG